MMKKETLLVVVATTLAAMAIFAACTTDDDGQTGQPLPPGTVRITATIAGQTDTRATMNNDGSGTFTTGDTWGMYTRLPDGTAINNNLAFAYGSTTLYWRDLGTTQPVTFSAHYPRLTDVSEGGNTPEAYRFSLLRSDMTKRDLLFATATASPGEEVKLNFRHLMHRLVVHLTKDDDVEGNLDEAQITVHNMKISIIVNLLDGTADAEIAIVAVEKPGIGATLDYITVPQNLRAGNDWITIELNNKEYYYNVPASLKPDPNDPHPLRLESGKQLTLNLNLKKSKVELTSSDITGWNFIPGSPEVDIDMSSGVKVAGTFAELEAAIADASGSTPTTILLVGNITAEAGDDLDIGDLDATPKHICIDGGGHTITCSNHLFTIFRNSSLELGDITLDGQGADFGSSTGLIDVRDDGTLIFNKGTIIQNVEGTDIRVNLSGSGSIAPIQMGAWPKMNGDKREQLKVSVEKYTQPIAAELSDFTLYATDFSLSRVTINGSGFNDLSLLEFYKDDTDHTINIRKKNDQN
ncbi:MAG: fimbrillin family protein [Bacteroides sp.]|nr:fimbrillin family protein [Bacteroides sp.]